MLFILRSSRFHILTALRSAWNGKTENKLHSSKRVTRSRGRFSKVGIEELPVESRGEKNK